MLYLIPSVYISFCAGLGGLLAILAYRKMPKMIRSSLVQMTQFGMVLLGPALLAFGILYGYFTANEVSTEVRQIVVRFCVFYLLVSVDLWLAILLRCGKNL